VLVYNLTLPQKTKLGIWKIEESPEELAAKLSNKTLADRHFQSISNNVRKQEFLCVRILIKSLCGEEKTITYNKEGKPSITDNSFHISISHTKGFVAILLHPTQTVGIDVELRGERILKLKEKFMHSTELKTIDKDQASLHILLHWSAKETLFKILPESEISFIEHLHVKPFSIKGKGSFEAFETRTTEKQEFKMHYQVFEDFILTWCTK
jgi:4'-phosphopantetheinyl transferase